jgi:hypothetical protein
LILSDAHLYQLVQDRPPGRIGQIDAAAAQWSLYLVHLRRRNSLRRRRIGRMSVPAQEVANATASLMATSILHSHSSTTAIHAEWLLLGLFASILLAIHHLFHESLRFLLVDKGESGQTWWALELE